MRHDFEYITFDCYGTLIDWETGIAEAFSKEFRALGPDVDRERILALHAEIEPQVQAGPYKPYREVLTEVTRAMAARLEWSLDPARAGFLAESVAQWAPFSDTNAALERLQRAGIKLGILSNIDDDLLERTLRHFTSSFDLLITAQQLRSYKPGHAHFLEAQKHLEGVRWLHAAQSYFHDVEPSVALDIPVAWVNRKHERASGAARPDAEVANLGGLADLLGAD
jgi:2-haloacid dehalogenase/putative hydrolase of the HAD superfamily